MEKFWKKCNLATLLTVFFFIFEVYTICILKRPKIIIIKKTQYSTEQFITPMTRSISCYHLANYSGISNAHSAPLRNNNNDNNDTKYKILLYR